MASCGATRVDNRPASHQGLAGWPVMDTARLVWKFGHPRKAGRIGVGRVLYGAKFNHEFSLPAEDRPIWHFGRKAASFSTPFEITPERAFAKWPVKPGYPRAVCIGWGKPWPAAINIASRGFGKPKTVAGGSSAWWWRSSMSLVSSGGGARKR